MWDESAKISIACLKALKDKNEVSLEGGGYKALPKLKLIGKHSTINKPSPSL